MEEVNERERLKHQELIEIEECRRRGWKAHCELTEVGRQGSLRALCAGPAAFPES